MKLLIVKKQFLLVFKHIRTRDAIISYTPINFRKLDRIKFYFVLYALTVIIYAILEQFYKDTEVPESNISTAIIIPVLEEIFFRLLAIGLLFTGLRSKKLKIFSVAYKFLLIIISLLYLLVVMKVFDVDALDYKSAVSLVTVILSICFLIASLWAYKRMRCDYQQLYLLLFSSLCFAIIHTLYNFTFRAIPPFFYGLMAGVLFINKAKLQNLENNVFKKEPDSSYDLWKYSSCFHPHVAQSN